ncbi:MAG: hypothetical protein ABJA82_01130 [Myxococcales bacterium]
MSVPGHLSFDSSVPSARAPQRRTCLLAGYVAVVSCTVAVSAVGCGDEHATVGMEPACAAPSGPLDPKDLIDDFEDGNSTIALVGARSGGWYSYGDTTAGGMIQPLGDAAPEAIPGGRGTSHRALHLTSTGFLDWGSGVSVALHWGPNAAGVAGELPYDAHIAHGVTFFARIGDTSASTVRVQFDDQRARPEAGICVVDGPVGQNCYDGFGTDLPALSTTWQAYRIAFADMRQRQFGVPGDALDTTQVYEMEFLFPAGVITDFWVDDVSLVR